MLRFYGEDGELVDNKEKFKFEENDINGNAYNFVGFIIENNKILAVFPKHFFDSPKKMSEKDNITLLFKVINKYIFKNESNSKAIKHFGTDSNYISDYPFAAFYKVYNYYQNYGIYKKEEMEFKKNAYGKVSWKKTIQKSNKIISNGNIIFSPLIYKQNIFKDDFISECMTFVINHTIKNFSYFIPFRPIPEKSNNFNFINNKKYVVEHLRQEKNSVFQNHKINLINALIDFFEQINNTSKGGSLHLKIRYFELIWQDMVEKYLNDYFVDVHEDRNKLIFDYSERQVGKRFAIPKEPIYIDSSKNKFKIEPDHYYENEKKIYVFDSKYYTILDDLNYKQLIYTILIGNSKMRKERESYSALFLPGTMETDLHVNLNEDYKQDYEGSNKIIEQYLDVVDVMKNYLDMEIRK